MKGKIYNTELVDEACSRINLLDYASQSYTFQKIGNNAYATQCPLHYDKTPSLVVNPEKGFWKCFSCEKKGRLLNWITEFEGLTYADACGKVLKLAGMDKENVTVSESDNLLEKFNRELDKREAAQPQREILDYLWYAKFPRFVYEPWVEEGIPAWVQNQYDVRFDDRTKQVLVPQYDAEDNLIGAKGRTTFPNYRELGLPKYRNLMKLGVIDFFEGMHVAREEVDRTKNIIIFEGVKSAMKAYSWGVKNAVAAGSCNLTLPQIELLLRMGVKNVMIAFDKDKTLEHVRKSVGDLAGMLNVFCLIDKENLLDAKDSPADKGFDVFKELWKTRVRL